MKQLLHFKAQFWNKIGIFCLIIGIAITTWRWAFSHSDVIAQSPQKLLIWGLLGAFSLLIVLVLRSFSFQKKALKSHESLLQLLFTSNDKAYLIYNFSERRFTAGNKAAVELLDANSKTVLLKADKTNTAFIRLLHNQLLVIKGEISQKGFFTKDLKINTFKDRTIFTHLLIQALEQRPDELLIRIEDRSNFQITEDLLKLFQVSLDQANELLFWVNKSGKITYANSTAYHKLLYENTQLSNSSIIDLMDTWTANKYEEIWTKTEIQQNTSQEAQILNKQGQKIEVSISLSYIKFKQHEMLCLLMRDITQEKEIIEQVVASTQQFRGIFEHSPNPMLLVNKKGKLIGANEAVCDLLQYTQTTLLQMQVDDLVHPLDRIVEKSFVFQKDVKEQIEEGKNPIYSVEKRYMTAKNKVIWTRSTLKPFDHTKDNQQAAALIIVEDITHQKKAKIALQRYASRLEESNKELTQFAYVVSHDLQEPLRMVASFLSLLEMRYGETLDKNAKEYIHYAVDGAKRMSGLIEDLLTYSRVNTKGKAFEPVDCNEVLQNVINKLTPLIQAHEVAVTFTHLPTLDADDAQMEQLFENLLENAIKFHSKIQATIHIKGEKREHTYLLSVKDNGIGMEHTYQDKIFGVFQRLHTRKEYAGSGIGLAICKRIVNRHNGRIWVESELNEGSTFYVELPKVNL